MPPFPRRLTTHRGQTARLLPARAVAALARPAHVGDPVVTTDVTVRLARFGLRLEGDDANHGPTLLWFRSTDGKTPVDPKALRAALRRPLAWVGPVYRIDGTTGIDGLCAPRADTLLVRTDDDRVAAQLKLTRDDDRSRWLPGWQVLRLPAPSRRDAFTALAHLRERAPNVVADFDYVPFARPFTRIPGDPLFPRQWNMTRIGAPDAWTRTTGTRGVVVAVLDSGCDLDHADLRHAYVSRGFNVGDALLDGSPIVHAPSGTLRSHGTMVAGVIAAAIDNATGLAGLASDCGMLPVAMPEGSTVDTAVAIRRAVAEGAQVLNLSWAIGSFFFDMHTRAAVDDAIAAGCVVCAAAGNGDAPTLVLPAGYPPVMACGGSDTDDRRWRDPSVGTGSHWGDAVRYGAPTGVSVVAPAIDITTTDITGPAGFTPAPSPGGDYATSLPSAGIPAFFHATSAATPHVSATAALLRSAYPALDAAAVRRIIERTAEKAGGYAYVDVDGYPNGSRHPETGYGRLHAARALDLGDVMIRDWPFDDGVEPSRPPGGNFWSTSDIVIRPTDDGIFDPADPVRASELVRGRDHVAYVRVRNAGPADARNVTCDVRATPYVGLQFVYPDDWTRDDALHVRPAPLDPPIATLAAGDERRLRFAFTAAQVDALAGWSDRRWHPCLLAVVRADNDHAFATAPGGADLQTRRNNLAQRNLTVVDVAAGGMVTMPIVVGHPAATDAGVRLLVNVPPALRAGGGELAIVIDDDGTGLEAARAAKAFTSGRFAVAAVKGGDLLRRGKMRAIVASSPRLSLTLGAPRPGRRPVQLGLRVPKAAPPGTTYVVDLLQRDRRGAPVGGGTLVVRVGKG